VSGFARVCDQIVAVDGGYALYPGARARSHPEQAEAVTIAAESAGAGCLVHRPKDVFFGNEVEKRQLSLSLAAPFLTPEEDWIVVFDADNHVLQANPDVVRSDLAKTDRNVATYTVLDGKDLLANPKTADLARTKALSTEWTHRTRGIYRWTPDLTYGPAHWFIQGTYGGVRQWIWGPEEHLDVAPAFHLESSLVVYHRSQHRAKIRADAAQDYYRRRNLAGIESYTHLLEAA